MKNILISILRDKNSPRDKFQEAAHKLSFILATEVSNYLSTKQINIETPMSTTQGVKLPQEIMIVIILRSAIAMLKPFLTYYPQASIGVIGLKRNEFTAKPEQYYCNLPPITPQQSIILIDPMLATGGSASFAIDLILKAGAQESQIFYSGIIGSKEGTQYLKEKYPKIKQIIAQIDPVLNDKKYIIPGLGDFGDRYFGTE